MKVEEKIAVNFFRKGPSPHIRPRIEDCRKCAPKPCLFVCPARLYSWEENTKEVKVETSGCLECGSCRLVCPCDLAWEYPEGHWGIQYRFG